MIVTILNKRHYPEGLPNNAVYVGRPTPLGNPWSALRKGTPDELAASRKSVIDQYRTWLDLQWKSKNPRVVGELRRLANILETTGELDLACWCSPKPCHADVIAKAVQIIVADKL
jgi:hypothetical protein